MNPETDIDKMFNMFDSKPGNPFGPGGGNDPNNLFKMFESKGVGKNPFGGNDTNNMFKMFESKGGGKDPFGGNSFGKNPFGGK